MKDLWNDGWFGRLIIFLMLFSIILFFLIIYASIKDKKEWDIFFKEHECKQISHQEGTVIPVFGVAQSAPISGVVIIPGHKEFLCNDGKTYRR